MRPPCRVCCSETEAVNAASSSSSCAMRSSATRRLLFQRGSLALQLMELVLRCAQLMVQEQHLRGRIAIG